MTAMSRRHTMWIAALLAVAWAAAPAAWAQKEQAKNIEDMTAFRTQVQAIRDQIAPVLTSLNGIVQNASANPTASFKTFSEVLFQEWEKKMGTITNPEIKAAAEANRAKLQELYKSIEPDIAAAKDTGNAFLSDLKDLRAYFQVDLSSGGIASVSNMVTKANTEGKTIQGMLDKVLSTVDQVKAQMAPGGTGQPKS